MSSDPESHVIRRNRPFVLAAYLDASAIFAPEANAGGRTRRKVNFVGSYVIRPVASIMSFLR